MHELPAFAEIIPEAQIASLSLLQNLWKECCCTTPAHFRSWWVLASTYLVLPCVKEISPAGNQPAQSGMHIYIYINIYLNTHALQHPSWFSMKSSGIIWPRTSWTFRICWDPSLRLEFLHSAFETNMSVKVPTIWKSRGKKTLFSRWWLNQAIWNIGSSNWIISPERGKHKEYLKPPVLYRQLVLTVEEKLMTNLFSQQFAHLPRYKLH